MDPLIGRTVSGCTLEARIGEGATGVVYRARGADGQPVAVKVVHEDMRQHRSLAQRYEREASVLSRLSHDNIVRCHGHGVVDGRSYLVMELLVGESLEDLLGGGPVDPERALRVVREALAGLAQVHDRGFVHRDLKPANLFLVAGERGERVEILDFGLAKIVVAEDASDRAVLTQQGGIVGTPAYIAPEQIVGGEIGPAADVYSMGVMLYELLADRWPFQHDDSTKLLRAHLLEDPRRPSEVREGLDLSPALEAVVMRAIEKQPKKRFPDARAMLEALEGLEPGAARRAPDAARAKRSAPTSVVISPGEQRAHQASIAGTPLAEVAPDGLAGEAAPGRPARPSAMAFVAGVLAVVAVGMTLWTLLR